MIDGDVIKRTNEIIKKMVREQPKPRLTPFEIEYLLSHKISPMRGKHHTKETKQKQRENMIKWHKEIGFSKKQINKIKKARLNQIFPFRDSKPERKIQNFLRLLHIEFLSHYYISKITHKYRCDVYIPSSKTIIEIDGCYWHGCPICNNKISEFQKEQVERDKIRTLELISKGYKVIRLWEHDIRKMELNYLKKRVR